MKFRLVIISFVFLVATACLKEKTEGITVSDVVFEQRMNEKDAQLVDVRTFDEFSSGHLINAMNIDVKADDFDVKVTNLDKQKPVLVYCKSGGRSTKAVEKLKNLGFTNIVELDGGITSWKANGKPIEN